MTAGLTLYNDSGTVQIDETWRNYGFRQKISSSLTTSNITGGAPFYIPYTLAISGTPALLCACRSSSQYPFRLHSYYSGGAWTINWLFAHDEGDSPVYDPTTKTGTVDFFIFDTMDGVYSNVGLEVWIDGGPRVFHSDAPVMKVGVVQPCSSWFSGASGREYAPLIMQIPAGGLLISGAGLRSAQYCMRASGSSINSKLIVNNSAGSLASGVSTGLYAAIDVTSLS